jgi:serine protease Do
MTTRNAQPTRPARIANRSATVTASVLLLAAPALAASPAADGVTRAATTLDARESAARSDANSLSRAFRAAARTLAPSVVTINTKSTVRAAGGTGTGAVVSADGYIVTANHVVADADEIELVFHDGGTAKATVVGLDPGTDIAVLKTDAMKLVPARFGDGTALDVGDWVVAIGAPFGLEQTVTAGIVSAKGRSDVGLATFENYIQTDAAINPGNSGGPLANLDGEIVGINSAISSRSGGNDGIGFAVPASVARRVVDSIIATGRVARGFLGVGVQSADDELLASLGASNTAGVVVNTVSDGSPAAAAGLEPGDVITAVDGQRIRTPGELVATVGERMPGSAVEITALREGDERRLHATLAERTDDGRTGTAKKQPPAAKPSALTRLGLALTELSASDAAASGLAAEGGVVVVESANDGGRAARAGIAAGDVIRRIANREVRTLDDASRAIDGLGEETSIPMLVERDGRARFVLIRGESAPSNTRR